MEGDRFRWTILGIVYLAMLSFALSLYAIPPVLPLIMRELSLSHAEGGLLMGVFALPGIAVALLAGMLSDRYGTRAIGGSALALMAAGSLGMALSREYGHLLLSRTISGVGAMAVSPVVFPLLSKWFLKKELGFAMGVITTAYPIGTLLSFTTFGYLGLELGWRAPLLVSVGMGILALTVFLLNCREPGGEGGHEGTPFRPSMIVGLGLSIWLLAFCWTSLESSIMSFLTFAPDYFLGRGMSLAFASALPAFVMAAPIVIQPLVGLAVDRVGRKEYFIGAGGVFLALLMLVMAGERESYLLPIILLGFFMSLVPGPVFALTPELVGPLYVGLGFGVLQSSSNVGRLFAPYAVGFARDYTGDYRAAFFLIALIALGVTVNIALLAIRRRRWEPDSRTR